MPSYGCPASLNSKKPFLEYEKNLSTSSQSCIKKIVPSQSYCLNRLINDFKLASTIAMLQQCHKHSSVSWHTSPACCLASSLVWISLDRYIISHGERDISDPNGHSLAPHPQQGCPYRANTEDCRGPVSTRPFPFIKSNLARVVLTSKTG